MTILSAALVALYTGAAVWRWKRIPESMSALVFCLSRPWQWVWIVWVWAVALLLTPPIIEAMPELLQVVAFFTTGMLMFVGAMPLVWGKSNTAHYALAITASIFSQVCVAVICSWWLLPWLLLPAGIVYVAGVKGNSSLEGKGVFVLEAICWICVTGCLITHFI